MPPTRFRVVRSIAEHLSDLEELYQSTWWAAARSGPVVSELLAGSTAVVGLVKEETDHLVGFARVLTGGRIVALILDVIVHPDMRGQGVGARLMDETLAIRELQGVDSVELVCRPELVEFYRRWGFTDRVGGSRLMRRSSNPALVDGGDRGQA